MEFFWKLKFLAIFKLVTLYYVFKFGEFWTFRSCTMLIAISVHNRALSILATRLRPTALYAVLELRERGLSLKLQFLYPKCLLQTHSTLSDKLTNRSLSHSNRLWNGRLWIFESWLFLRRGNGLYVIMWSFMHFYKQIIPLIFFSTLNCGNFVVSKPNKNIANLGFRFIGDIFHTFKSSKLTKTKIYSVGLKHSRYPSERFGYGGGCSCRTQSRNRTLAV